MVMMVMMTVMMMMVMIVLISAEFKKMMAMMIFVHLAVSHCVLLPIPHLLPSTPF
jgi:hypothetical protein